MIKRIKINLIKITLLLFCSLFITVAYGLSDAFSICIGESVTLTRLSTPHGPGAGSPGTEPWGGNSVCSYLSRTIEPNNASVKRSGSKFVVSPTETTSYVVSSQYIAAGTGSSCNPSAIFMDTITIFVEDCSEPDEVLTICQGGHTTINLNDLIFSDDCAACTLDSFENVNWFADGKIISNKAVLSISPLQTTSYIAELTGASNCDIDSNCEPGDALVSPNNRFTKIFQLEVIDCPQQEEIPKTFTLCPGDTAIIPVSYLPALPPVEIAVHENCSSLDRIVRPAWGRIIEDERILLFPSETTEYSIISSWGPSEQSDGTCISSGESISNFLIEVIINCNQEPDSTTYTICPGESVILFNEDLASPPDPIPGTNDCDNLLRFIEPSNGVGRNSSFYTLRPTTTTTYTIISEHSNFKGGDCTPSDKYVSVIEVIVEDCSEPDEVRTICKGEEIMIDLELNDFVYNDHCLSCNALSFKSIDWVYETESIAKGKILTINPLETTQFTVDAEVEVSCSIIDDRCEQQVSLPATLNFTKVYQIEVIDCASWNNTSNILTICPGDTAIIPYGVMPPLPPIEININENCNMLVDREIKPNDANVKIESNKFLLSPNETTVYTVTSAWGSEDTNDNRCPSSGTHISTFLVEVIEDCEPEEDVQPSDFTSFIICPDELITLSAQDLISPPPPPDNTSDQFYCNSILRHITPIEGVERVDDGFILTPATSTTYTITSWYAPIGPGHYCRQGEQQINIIEVIVEDCEPGNIENLLDFIECPQDHTTSICAPVSMPPSLILQDFSTANDSNFINSMSMKLEEQTDVHKYFNTTTRLYTISDESGNQKTCETKHHIANQFLQMPEVTQPGVICEEDLWSYVKIGIDQYKIYADQNGTKGTVMSTCNTPGLICSTASLGLDTDIPGKYNFWASTFFEFPDGSICESEAMPFYVDVQAKPAADLSVSNQTINAGEGIALMDLVTTNKSGFWSGKNIIHLMTAGGENLSYFSSNAAGIYKLYYTVKNDFCERSYLLVVNVNHNAPGCTDEEAYNYNPAATVDDGSCINPDFNAYNYPWLSSLINSFNCSQQIELNEYHRSDNTYIYIENESGGILYLEDGTIYCSDEDGETCLENNSLLLGNPTYKWACFEDVLQKFNWVYTICEGDSISLLAKRDKIEIPCICEECIPIPYGGPTAPPEVIWSLPAPLPGSEPESVICNNAHCGSVTLNPTATTHYSAVTEADVYSKYARCDDGPPGPPDLLGGFGPGATDPPGSSLQGILTYSDFLVIVEQCPLAKPTTTNQAQKTIRKSFNIYPNPATNKVFIDLPELSNYQINLFDISGKVVKERNTKIDASTIEINVSNLPKGMYMLELKNELTHNIQKLIIE